MAKQLNPAFAVEVIKFQASPAGVALMDVLRDRRPAWPAGTESSHEYLRRSGAIEGYENCLDVMLKIPQELQPENPNDKPDPALFTRD